MHITLDHPPHHFSLLLFDGVLLTILLLEVVEHATFHSFVHDLAVLLLLLQALDLAVQLVFIHHLPRSQFMHVFLLVVIINLILVLEHCCPLIEDL